MDPADADTGRISGLAAKRAILNEMVCVINREAQQNDRGVIVAPADDVLLSLIAPPRQLLWVLGWKETPGSLTFKPPNGSPHSLPTFIPDPNSHPFPSSTQCRAQTFWGPGAVMEKNGTL